LTPIHSGNASSGASVSSFGNGGLVGKLLSLPKNCGGCLSGSGAGSNVGNLGSPGNGGLPAGGDVVEEAGKLVFFVILAGGTVRAAKVLFAVPAKC